MTFNKIVMDHLEDSRDPGLLDSSKKVEICIHLCTYFGEMKKKREDEIKKEER